MSNFTMTNGPLAYQLVIPSFAIGHSSPAPPPVDTPPACGHPAGMTTPVEIAAPGIDVERLMKDIEETVARKAAQGAYADARIARAERTNLLNLRNDDEFLAFYLRSLREAAFVDINDFDIRERRSAAAPLLVALKKVIWKLLKFYTYRLWSQQNTVNGLVVTGIESLEEQYRERIARLESRVAELEKQARGSKPA